MALPPGMNRGELLADFHHSVFHVSFSQTRYLCSILGSICWRSEAAVPHRVVVLTGDAMQLEPGAADATGLCGNCCCHGDDPNAAIADKTVFMESLMESYIGVAAPLKRSAGEGEPFCCVLAFI